MSKYSKRYGFFMIKERFALYFSKCYSVRYGSMRFVLLPSILFAFKPRNLRTFSTLLRKMANDPHPPGSGRSDSCRLPSSTRMTLPICLYSWEIDTFATKSLRLSLQTQVTVSVLVTVLKFPSSEKPADSQISHWLLRGRGLTERIYKFGTKLALMGPCAPLLKPCITSCHLSIRHSYVRVLLNGVPVINSRKLVEF